MIAGYTPNRETNNTFPACLLVNEKGLCIHQHFPAEIFQICRSYSGNRIAVRFEYEYHDEAGKWFRAHGNEVLQLSLELPSRPHSSQTCCGMLLKLQNSPTASSGGSRVYLASFIWLLGIAQNLLI
jgi:hypothetical protein